MSNPMIQAALDSDEDTTGLCTVREVAEMLYSNKADWLEMCFKHNGKWMNVEIKLTRVSDKRSSEE